MQRQRRHASELAAAKEALQQMEEQLAARDDREHQLTLEAEALIAQHIAAARIQRGYHRYCSTRDSRVLIRAHAIQSRKSTDELSKREFKVTQLEAQLAARHESLNREGSTIEQDALITKLAADLEKLREQHKAALAAADREPEMQKAQAQQAIEAAVTRVRPSFAPTRADTAFGSPQELVIGQSELLQSPHGTHQLDRVGPTQPVNIRPGSSLATTAAATRTKIDTAARNEKPGERRSVSRESIKRSSEALLRRLADAEAAAHANIHSSAAAMQLTFSTIQQHQHQVRSAAQAASGI